MYAAIIQSYTPQGIRQTVIVPTLDHTVEVFTRLGASRGSAGAWKSETPPLTGKTVGDVVTKVISPSDYTALSLKDPQGKTPPPTVLVQKLAREVKGVLAIGAEDFADVYNDVYELAKSNPIGLANYTRPTVLSPSVQVNHSVQPIRVPSVVAPYFPQEDIALPSPEYVAEQAVTAPPTLVESEPAMEFSSVIAPPMPNATASHAVITIPEREAYFERKWFGLTEHDVLKSCQSNSWAVLYTGDAGTGKSSSARNYAAVEGIPFVTIECTQQIDNKVTQGQYVATGVPGALRWQDSALATVIQQPSVVLINELTRMSPKAAGLFLRLLQERELVIETTGQKIAVHPQCLFIADQNTGIGYTGTSKQDAALIDRFALKLEFHYDIEIEKKFINSPTLLQFAQNIREACEANDEFSVPMSTRILKNFQAQALALNFEFAVESLLSNFPKLDGEREAIKMRFDADADAIASELGVDVGNYSTR